MPTWHTSFLRMIFFYFYNVAYFHCISMDDARDSTSRNSRVVKINEDRFSSWLELVYGWELKKKVCIAIMKGPVTHIYREYQGALAQLFRRVRRCLSCRHDDETLQQRQRRRRRSSTTRRLRRLIVSLQNHRRVINETIQKRVLGRNSNCSLHLDLSHAQCLTKQFSRYVAKEGARDGKKKTLWPALGL